MWMSAEWGAVLAVGCMVIVNIATVAFFLGGLRSEVRAQGERISNLEHKIFHV
jgi:hypothetical protein